jgi:hypothetical protein
VVAGEALRFEERADNHVERGYKVKKNFRSAPSSSFYQKAYPDKQFFLFLA